MKWENVRSLDCELLDDGKTTIFKIEAKTDSRIGNNHMNRIKSIATISVCGELARIQSEGVCV